MLFRLSSPQDAVEVLVSQMLVTQVLTIDFEDDFDVKWLDRYCSDFWNYIYGFFLLSFPRFFKLQRFCHSISAILLWRDSREYYSLIIWSTNILVTSQL